MASPVRPGSVHEPATDHSSPVPHYLGALVTSALVIGLAFFIKDAPTKWIVVIVGIIMFITSVGTFAQAMAKERKRT
jgi:ABC-type Fe3+-siderophore transport system permease subunit